MMNTAQGLEAVGGLALIVATLYGLGRFIMGPERGSRTQHPSFGRFTPQVPNALSALRFPLGLWLVVVHVLPGLHSPLWHLSVHLSFWLIALFDILDGQFARKWSAISEDGKSLDPASDKYVTFCLAAAAALFGRELPWWAVAVVASREVLSVTQRTLLSRRGIDVSARWLGKIKTVVQFTVLYILILRIDTLPGTIGLDLIAAWFPAPLILWGVLLMCFCTVISLFPFYESFSYVNNYPLVKRPSTRPWYVVAVPNAFTIGNYLCGVTAVFFAMPQVEVVYRPFVALFWIMAAAFFDALDGPLARKLKVNSELGDCLDASTDLSTFGLSVGTIIFLLYAGTDLPLWFGAVVGGVYFWSVHLRLARFTALQAARPDPSTKGDFVGLPSPSGAFGVLLFLTLFYPLERLTAQECVTLTMLVLMTSYLMVSRYDFISHSNAVKNRFYRRFMIPIILSGFALLFVLVFQQPFVSHHFSRELVFYFRACSWVLATMQLIYILDGIRRGPVPRDALP